MPLILYYIADRAAIRGGDCMFVSLLPLWQMLDAEDGCLQLRRGTVPRDPGIGEYLAAAYDMHTRDGRNALRRFARESCFIRRNGVKIIFIWTGFIMGQPTSGLCPNRLLWAFSKLLSVLFPTAQSGL